MIRSHRILARIAPLFAFCAVVLGSQAGHAQAGDTALFTTRVPPNVMLVIDTSGSMNNVVWHPAFRMDLVYNPALCPNGYIPNDATCTAQYLKYPLCSMTYGQNGFDLGSNDTWSNVPDNTFRTLNGHDVTISGALPAGCVATRNVFNDPDIAVAPYSNQTRWQLEYLQWYFSQNADWDHDGNGTTIVQEILSTNNGATSSCLLAEPTPPPATFGKFRRSRITAAQQILRDVICQTSQVADIRYGLAKFDANGTDPAGGYVRLGIANYTTSHRDTLITRIEALEGEAWTPLAETLFNVYRYFMSRASNEQAWGKLGTGTTRFPAYGISETGTSVSAGSAPGHPVTHDCQKHFVVFITDGEPTKDRFSNGGVLGTNFSNFDTNLIGDYNQPVGDETDETPPNNFFAPVMDGNSCGGSGGASETCGVGLYLDDVAKFMHDNDFFPGTAFPSNQTIDVYTVGFATAGAANALLQKAADVGGGDFFSSNNPDELTVAITNSINSIVAKSQAFTSAAVPASRTTSGDNFYSAYFLPVLDTPFWIGHLKNFDFSASGEVLTPSGNCAIGVDPTDVPPCDATGSLRTTAAAFWDAATAMPNPPTTRKLYLELGNTAWLAQPSALQTPVTAAEETSMGPTLASAARLNVATADYLSLPYSGLASNNTGLMASALSRYLRGCTFLGGPACVARVDGGGQPEYLGDIFHSNPLVVGSPNQAINETTYQTFADTYRTRPRVIYAGANDGWLHGFQAGVWSTALNPDGYTRGSGQELMGFMPYWIRRTINEYVKHSTGLRTAVTVDGSPVAADVWLNRASNGTGAVDPDMTAADKVAAQWRTVLIQGLRDGGQTYSALDITDPPAAVGTATTTYPRYLWGFPVEDPINGENDGTAGETAWMGNTWSEPVITRVRVKVAGGTDPRGYERWVAVFGAGYHATGDPNSSGFVLPTLASKKGRAIYMVDITTGEVLAKKSFLATAPALDATAKAERQGVSEFYYAFASAPAVFDLDFDGFADVIYIGDLGGNLWKWVVKAPGYDPINGGSYSFPTADGYSPTATAADQPDWPFRRVFHGSASTDPPTETIGGVYNPLVHYQSFFFPPTGVLRSGKLLLAFGAGERADPIGVAADLDGCTGSSTPAACLNNNHYYVVKDDDPYERVGSLPHRWTGNYSETNLLDVDVATPPTCAAVTAAQGYFITARDSEKFVSNSTVFLGTVFTGSFVPNLTGSGACDSKGTAYLYAFDLDCGVGEFPGPGSNQDDRRTAIGSGLPTRPRVSVGDLNQGGGGGCPSPPCCINKVVVVTSDGEIYNDCPDDLPTSGVKVRSWRER